jgi:hypothetical protein
MRTELKLFIPLVLSVGRFCTTADVPPDVYTFNASGEMLPASDLSSPPLFALPPSPSNAGGAALA